MGSAYSLDNATFIELPVAPRNDPMLGEEIGENAFETNTGVRWIYELFNRDRWELSFILTKDQLPDFRDMHDTVGREPFYFRLTDASPAEYIYCRKEPGFMPRGIGLATETGKPIFELRMVLVGEVDAEDIEL